MLSITPFEDWLIKTALVAMGLIVGYFLQRFMERTSAPPPCPGSCKTQGNSESNMTLILVDLATIKAENHAQSTILKALKKDFDDINQKFGTLRDEHIRNHHPP
ncbi:MAG: hypothetical protein WCO63_15895 [Bacteroidota bacterium]